MTWIATDFFVRCSPISTGLRTDQWRGVRDDGCHVVSPPDTTPLSSFSSAANFTAIATDHPKGEKDAYRNVYINQRYAQILVSSLSFFFKWLYMFRTIVSPSSGTTFNKLYSATGTCRYVWLLYSSQTIHKNLCISLVYIHIYSVLATRNKGLIQLFEGMLTTP